ncbi:hypothetical protein PSQ20_03705 [Curvibacter sp. RS43]|uniref:hypothetical protein n=1 Tax=Curvibacter microcysteis TaxID=3026419 RepID=UPI002361CF02|nr:hypothetical protein [Curvibacter sp. RS43]MDD0809427.1 hypothetical protein [Curvibacter sp. RS43]
MSPLPLSTPSPTPLSAAQDEMSLSWRSWWLDLVQALGIAVLLVSSLVLIVGFLLLPVVPA